MAYLSYLALVLLWPLLLWPVVRGPDRARPWLLPGVALGALASGWEAWMLLGSGATAAIRLDIPLLVVALALGYLLAAVGLLRAGGRGARAVALGAGGVALLAVAGFSAGWARAGAEGARAMAVRAEADALLFEARFRDEATYRWVFGMDAEDRGAPAGHWEPTGRSPLTRLVVNPAGRAVPFFGCGDTECAWGDGVDLEAAEGPAGATVWRGVAVNRGVGEMALALEAAGPDTLRVRVRDRETVMARTEPPLGPGPDDPRLERLGAFASVVPTGSHARVVQLWLWEDGAGLLAVGVVETLVPGGRADFVTPVRLGRGVPEAGGHRFRWEQRGQAREARVAVTGTGVVWTPVGEGWDRGSPGRPPAGPVVLAPEPVFRDEAIELAPLDDAEAWNAWMDVQLSSHFTSGFVPEVSEAPAGG